MPVKGATVKLDTSNLCLYERIIDVYENNDLRVDGSTIYINNKPADSYTFKMNYYWMMGDNRIIQLIQDTGDLFLKIILLVNQSSSGYRSIKKQKV